MRKIIAILSLIFTVLFLFAAFNKRPAKEISIAAAPNAAKTISHVGEKIIYDVRLGSLSLGRAVFEHLSRVKLKNRIVNLMTFETRLAKFSDLERIYSDPQTYLPLRVERSVSAWPKLESIVEDYDQKKFILTITKHSGKKAKEQVMIIRKDNVINNAILLPYYVRDTAQLSAGFSLLAKLPTQEFTIELAGKEEVRVPAGRFSAYHFISRPKKFEIWISADERKIPIKIKGSSAFGYTLAMKEYRGPN